jgi:DNA-directed RNA polymerase specialized sigma24 family protein
MTAFASARQRRSANDGRLRRGSTVISRPATAFEHQDEIAYLLAQLSAAERAVLEAAFLAGRSTLDIARTHQKSRWSINRQIALSLSAYGKARREGLWEKNVVPPTAELS